MNHSMAPRDVFDRVGMPKALFAGFLGVLLFMIGDGVESNYLSPFLVSDQGFTESTAALAISLYGIVVAIASWLAGTLSTIWGPRRVMLLGALNWVILEVVFLTVGVGMQSAWVITLAYALRGIGYPFFAFGFLVWLNSAVPAHQRGTSVGWFWFVFGAGLPMLGSLVASATIPIVGEYHTFWISLGLVMLGSLIALLGIRDREHAGPSVDKSDGQLMEMVRGLTILWREPRISAGAFVRLVNTTPNFALFVIAPFFFVEQIGFSQSTYLLIVTIVYTTNIFANLVFGIVADHFGWRRTITWFGCVMCGIGILLLYYVPVWAGASFWLTVACWSIFGIGLSGFVPLTALMPSSVGSRDTGNALAIYTLAAGLSQFIGPALVAVLGGADNMEMIIWVFAVLYFLAAGVSYLLKTSADPAQARAAAGSR